EYLLSLARQEADADCERLFAFKGELPMYFADVTATWQKNDRYRLMCALIKHRLSQDVGTEESLLTQEETVARALFDWPITTNWRTPGKMGVVHIGAITGKAWELDAEKLELVRRGEKSLLGQYKLDRNGLKREIRAAMKPVFGEPQKSAGIWKYW